jgi:catechol 2,3-dioxygenase-like lactoylglutathione lyase family enzyme
MAEPFGRLAQPSARPKRFAIRAALAVTAIGSLILSLEAPTILAQRAGQGAQVSPGSFVSGSGNFSPMVMDLDRTVAFYHDALGLTLSAAESARPVPWDTEPWHRDLHGSQGSPMRFATARVPGGRLAVEMVEQGSIARHPVQLRVQDPGNVSVILLVRDVDKILAAARQAGAPVVTLGGAPIAVATGDDKGRAVVVRDPDGHFVEFLQLDPLPATTAPAESNLIGSWIRVTVADTAQTLHLYRDLFGLEFLEEPFSSDRSMLSLLGLKGAQLRFSIARIPGSKLEFLEVKGVDRKPIHSHIEDPGSTRFQLTVRNLESAITMLRSAGPSTIVSNTGKILPDGSWEKGPIDRTNVRWLTVTDLNNVFLVLSDRPAGAPGRGQGGAGRAGATEPPPAR